VFQTEPRFIVAVGARSSRADHPSSNFAIGQLRFLRISEPTDTVRTLPRGEQKRRQRRPRLVGKHWVLAGLAWQRTLDETDQTHRPKG
jgi:hypothetical protein